MEDQLGALGLALNSVVLFNSLYIDTAVKQLAADGFPVTDELLTASPHSSTTTSPSSAATPSPGLPRRVCGSCVTRTPMTRTTAAGRTERQAPARALISTGTAPRNQGEPGRDGMGFEPVLSTFSRTRTRAAVSHRRPIGVSSSRPVRSVVRR